MNSDGLAELCRDAIEEVQQHMGPIKPKLMLHKCAEAYMIGFGVGMNTAAWIESVRLQKALAECPEP